MEKRRIGGGLLAGAGILGPWVGQMMGLTVPAPVGWVLIALCGVAALVGLALVFWPPRRNSPPESVPAPTEPTETSAPRGGTAIYLGGDDSQVIGGTISDCDNGIVSTGDRNKVSGVGIRRIGKRREDGDND
jgi:hypothetical protein